MSLYISHARWILRDEIAVTHFYDSFYKHFLPSITVDSPHDFYGFVINGGLFVPKTRITFM